MCGERDAMVSVTVFHADGSVTLRSWFLDRASVEDLAERMGAPDVTQLVPLDVRVGIAAVVARGVVALAATDDDPT